MTRDELYALVWENPAIHVAKRVGISTARLRKICKDFNVPIPPAGYWTKLAHGKTVEQPALPQAAPTTFGKLGAAFRRLGEIPLKLADAQIEDFALDFSMDEKRDKPPSASSLWHPQAAALKTALESAAADDGFLVLARPDLPVVKIRPASVERALRLVDAVVCRVLAQGHRVGGYENQFCFDVDGEVFTPKVYETRDRKAVREPDAAMQGSAIDPRSSGKLCLEIVDPRPFRWSNRNLVGQWHDRESKPIEACAADAAKAMETAAALVKYCRARADDHAKRLAREADRRKVAEAMAGIARRRVAYLDEKAAAYARLINLTQFAAFIESSRDGNEGDPLDRLARELKRLIAEARATFHRATLNEEILRLALLSEDPSGERETE